jgi:hypothetical protein
LFRKQFERLLTFLFQINKLTEEKNDLRKKLEDAYCEINLLKTKCAKQAEDVACHVKSLSEFETEIAYLKNRDDLKQRKIDGLLKIVKQKTSEIEALKANPNKPHPNEPLRNLIESLEKEVEIYKNLNKSPAPR